MGRPKNRLELLEASEKGFQSLMEDINQLSLPEQEEDFPPGTMNRNIRDVLGHLHHWHKMMAGWYEIGMTGEKPEMPAPGYTWKTVPALNREIHQMYTAVPLEELKVLLAKSHISMMVLIEQHMEEELFEKKRYHWTGSTSLAAYLISATSSHYVWARKLIRKQRKALNAVT